MAVINYGTLRKWMSDAQYGFVRDDASGKDLFAHVSAFVEKVAPPEGTRLKYHIVPNPKKIGRTMIADAEVIVSRVIAAQYSANSGVL
jgi:cold shock CspA family protein